LTSNMPPVHPAAEALPMMSEEALRALAADIKANGLREPVTMLGPRLLDGRNRWLACEMAGVDIRTRDWAGDALSYVRSLNLHRRHLTPVQMAAAAVKLEPVYEEEAAKKQTEGRRKGGQLKGGNHPKAKQDDAGRALAQAAKEVGASLDSAKAMKQVSKAAPEVIELVQRGHVETVADAKRVAALPEDTRAEVVQLVKAGSPVSEAFSVAGATEKMRQERETPTGQVIAAIEIVRKSAATVRSACARLEDLANKFNVTEMRSPEFAKAGLALLQARSDISRVIEQLRVKETT